VGLWSYDEFTTAPVDRSVGVRLWRVDEAEVQPWSQGSTVGFTNSEASKVGHEHQDGVTPWSDVTWEAQKRPEDYLSIVGQIHEAILSGRYYQLNYLRYWHTQFPLTFEMLAHRWFKRAGPYGCWIKDRDLEVVSFSPEQFLSLEPNAKGFPTWTSRPIKGTAPRGLTVSEDQQLHDELARSEKNRAELAMIVDLMRNDLAQISKPGSVEVESGGRVESFYNVHHLVATIHSRMREEMTWGQIIKSLCPAGSITGAPKREVMQAIRELEGRDRGWQMGHMFWIEDRGWFGSNVLIRTLVREGTRPWEFAAGSGITLLSDPQSELQEVADKLRIIT